MYILYASFIIYCFQLFIVDVIYNKRQTSIFLASDSGLLLAQSDNCFFLIFNLLCQECH